MRLQLVLAALKEAINRGEVDFDTGNVKAVLSRELADDIDELIVLLRQL